jgi:hypothetical protein
MATTLPDANRAAHTAREHGTDRLEEMTLTQIRNHYRSALRGDTDNHSEHTTLADKAHWDCRSKGVSWPDTPV